MPKEVGQIIVGGLAIAAGVIIPGAQPLIKFGIATAASGVMGLIFGSRGFDQAQSGALRRRADPQGGVPLVYGTTKVGLAPVHIEVDDASEDRKFLAWVGAIAAGSRDGSGINDVSEVFFNERTAILDPSVGDGLQFSGVQDPYDGSLGIIGQKVSYGLHMGSRSQPADSDLVSRFSSWTTSHRGLGVAYLYLGLVKDKEVLPTIPQTITAIIDGVSVHDPRDDTWKFSDNPSLCIRDFLLRGDYGLEAPEAELNTQSFKDVANLSEEQVSRPDGTRNRFSCNGWVSPKRSIRRNLADLLTSCRGSLIYQGGEFRLVVNQANITPHSQTLDQDIIVDGSWEFTRGGVSQVANVGKATFPDPDQRYQPNTAIWPDPDVSNPWISEDGGQENIVEVDLPFTADFYEAQHILQTKLKEARQDVHVQVTCSEAALVYQVGDVVEVTHPTPGWTDEQFLVAAMSVIPPQGEDDALTVRLALREYDSAAYSFDSLPQKTPLPGTNLPDPFSVADPTALTLTSDQTTQRVAANGSKVPRIFISWTKPAEPFLDFVEVLAREQGASEWQSFARVEEFEDQETIIEGWSEGTTVEVAVQSVTTRPMRGNKVTGTVTMSTDWVPGDDDEVIPRVDVEPVRTLNPLQLQVKITGTAGPDGPGPIEVAHRLDDERSGGGSFGSWVSSPSTETIRRGVTQRKYLVAKARDTGVVGNPESNTRVFVIPPLIDIPDIPGRGGGPVDDRRVRDHIGGEMPGQGRMGGPVYRRDGVTRTYEPQGGAFENGTLFDSMFLNAGVRQTDGARTGTIHKAQEDGQHADGDGVNFGENYQNIPSIQMISGWKTYDPVNLDSAKAHRPDIRASNPSASGFTQVAKLQEADINTTAQQVSFSADTIGGVGIDGDDYSADKGGIADAWDDKYTYNFDISAVGNSETTCDGNQLQNGCETTCDGGSITVGGYTNDGSGWVLRFTESQSADCTDTSRAGVERTVSVSGLGNHSGKEFAMGVESESSPGGSYTANHVAWETSSGVTKIDATEGGRFPAQHIAYAKDDG